MPVTITDNYGTAISLAMPDEQEPIALAVAGGGTLTITPGLSSGIVSVRFAMLASASVRAIVSGLAAASGAVVASAAVRARISAIAAAGAAVMGSASVSARGSATGRVSAAVTGGASIVARGRASVVVDPDAATYIAAVEAADGQALEDGVTSAINDFVIGCKADGIWTAIKASCILAGARTLNGALVPLAGSAPTNFNFVSADYDRKTGLKGDAATKYLDSNRNNNADPQDSQHLAAWVTEQPNATTGTGITYLYLGATANQAGTSVIGRSGTGAKRMLAQSRHGTNYVNTLDAVTGFHGKSRSASAEFTVRVNGANATQSAASVTPRDENLTVFAAGGAFFALNRISFYSIGESIDLAALDSRVSALMTALDGAIA